MDQRGPTTPEPSTLPEHPIDQTLRTPARGYPVMVPGALFDLLGAAFAGRYKSGAPIAKGGIGRVVSADDLALQREVAVKELLDPESEAARVRFEREARLTARLEHPGIVSVHEFGRRPSGELYLVMRKVRGEPLSAAIKRAQSVSDRLALLPALAAIADAVGYAHSQGIVHRDLKPSNVLLGTHGETVVVDWGLAKDLRAPADEATVAPQAKVATAVRVDRATPGGAGVTVAGSLLGTPEFMSPEQARGEAADERSDVYSLGVMLYHALCGEVPYTANSSTAVLVALLAGPPEPLASRVPGLPPELVAIVERAMARDPGQRYENGAALAADLRRYQTGRLVEAHRYSLGALAARWARKHAALLVVIGVASALLAGGGVVSVQRVVAERDRANVERDRANSERDRANREAESARRVAAFLSGMFNGVNPDSARGRDITAREVLDKATKEIDSGLEKDPLVQAQLMLTMGAVYNSMGLAPQGRALVEKAVATRARLLGATDPQTVAARVELVELVDDPPAAAREARATLALLRAAPPPQDELAIARVLSSLGNDLVALDQQEEAEATLKESIDLRRRVAGPKSFELGQSLGNLGNLFAAQHRAGEAAALHRQALDIFRADVGDDSPFTLMVIQNLAADLYSSGDLAGALVLQQDELATARRVVGPEHPQVLQALGNLANTYSALGRYDEAQATLEQVLAVATRLHLANLQVGAHYNLACVAGRQGKEGPALEHLRAALKLGLPPPMVRELSEDADLAPLRGRPAFDAFVKQAQQQR